jgi:hypothetical protein
VGLACARKISVWPSGLASLACWAYLPPPIASHVEFTQL